jgi:hypothetical protein
VKDLRTRVSDTKNKSYARTVRGFKPWMANIGL